MTTQGEWRSRIVDSGTADPKALRANPKNWRTHPPAQRRAMIEMFERIGWVQDVIVNRTTGNLIDGHLRVEVAIERGQPTVPVVYVELSEAEEAEVLATYDPLAAMAETSRGTLAALLGDLHVPGELGNLLEQLAQEQHIDLTQQSAPDDPDAAPPVRAEREIVVKVGEVWQLGRHRLVVGDCTDPEVMAMLWTGIEQPAGMIFTDPPYNMDYKSKALGGIENDDLSEAEFVRLLLASSKVALDHLRTGGSYYICMGAAELTAVIRQLRKLGLGGRPIVWVKPSAGLGSQDYRPQSEFMLYGYTGKRSQRVWNGKRMESDVWTFDPDRGVVARKAEGGGTILEVGLGAETVQIFLNQAVTGVVIAPDGATSDVWRFARERGTYEHPTQKPVALVRRAIGNSSRPRDIVLDPFLGSGTTLVAAELSGRTCFGVELDPKYAQVVVDRYEALFSGKAERLN